MEQFICCVGHVSIVNTHPNTCLYLGDTLDPWSHAKRGKIGPKSVPCLHSLHYLDYLHLAGREEYRSAHMVGVSTHAHADQSQFQPENATVSVSRFKVSYIVTFFFFFFYCQCS